MIRQSSSHLLQQDQHFDLVLQTHSRLSDHVLKKLYFEPLVLRPHELEDHSLAIEVQSRLMLNFPLVVHQRHQRVYQHL